MQFPRLSGLLRFGGRQPLPPREAYALWAETYPARPHTLLMKAEQAVVEPLIEAAMPIRALDVGTGTGRYLPLLESAGAHLVVGLDLSLAMLGRMEDEGRRVCGDARRLPFRGATFDLICSSLMVGDLPDLPAWVRETARVLAPGGHLIYSDFHPSWTAERWRRTFRSADGRLRELAYFPHTIDEHLSLLQEASFSVRAIREPRVSGRTVPVVVVFHAVKPGRRASNIRLKPDPTRGLWDPASAGFSSAGPSRSTR
jgi:SAM-dependent methyltransferase